MICNAAPSNIENTKNIAMRLFLNNTNASKPNVDVQLSFVSVCTGGHFGNVNENSPSAKLAPALPLETNYKQPLIQEFLRCAGQKKPVGVDYFCDASVLSAGGIPSVVFGPGDIAQAHTADEWILLSELEAAKNLLLRFLKSLP